MATSNEEDEVISKQLTQLIGDLSIDNNISTVCAKLWQRGGIISIFANKCKAADVLQRCVQKEA